MALLFFYIIIIIIIIIITVIMAIQPFLGPWPLFQFLDVVRSPLDSFDWGDTWTTQIDLL
jgi:hypothetical protein